MQLRKPDIGELAAINAMIRRSKAHWGYDQEFLDACREELAFTTERLASGRVRVTGEPGWVTGTVEISLDGKSANIGKLFVDPQAIGSGAGRMLYEWALNFSRQHNAGHMMIESDPFAQGFYEKMGAVIIGKVPSGSISGRFLPLLRHEL